jgi:DNA-binding NarL/FixJ family response regulator
VPASFLIVDDHPLFRDALRLAIESSYPKADIQEASTVRAAREALAAAAFDLVLLDLSMPGTRGFDGLLEIRTSNPRQPVVIVSGLEDPRIIHEAMTYGAAGFILKSVRKAELAEAISDVMNGLVYLPRGYEPPKPEVPGAKGSDLATRLGTLTPQQLRVLQMLRQGMLNKQIAFELDVGETTIKAHVSEILRKLNVASRTQAVIEVSRIDFDKIAGTEDVRKEIKAGPNR